MDRLTVLTVLAVVPHSTSSISDRAWLEQASSEVTQHSKWADVVCRCLLSWLVVNAASVLFSASPLSTFSTSFLPIPALVPASDAPCFTLPH